MAEYRLHCFPESGSCYKVALMLSVAGADWAPAFIDYFSGVTRTPAWRATVSEMGEAPVLEHAGMTLSQSGAILHYLADRLGRFGAATDRDRYEILRWVLFDNHKFTSYYATYRFMNVYAPQPPDAGAMAFLKGRIDAAYAVVDKHLGRMPFMVGETPTIADFSLAGYVFYPATETGHDLPGLYPNVGKWMDRLRALPGWEAPYDLLPGKRAPYREGAVPP